MPNPYPSFECAVGYDADVACVTMTWKGYATSREFREANERIIGVITEHEASKLLGDIRDISPEGILRQPSFVGLREGKPAEQVRSVAMASRLRKSRRRR